MSDVIDTKKTRQHLAANVTFLMNESNMSLADLADAAGSKVTTMHRLKHGINDPAFTLVARIADYFQIATDDLMREPKEFKQFWTLKNKRKAVAV